jgi:hypothetical protein
VYRLLNVYTSYRALSSAPIYLIEYAATVADGIVWAHWHTLLLLPIVSHGPIGICCCCRWYRMGPLADAAAAADAFAWAHWHMQLLLPMASHGPIGICSCCCRCFRMGPLAYAAAAADSIAWAQSHMQLLLPMVSHGPIGICCRCCRWFRVGPCEQFSLAPRQLPFEPRAAASLSTLTHIKGSYESFTELTQSS